MADADVDVLVVGAGPTGLMHAINLRLHGVQNVRIVDKLHRPSGWAKASATQPRSLQVYEAIGGNALTEMLTHGIRAAQFAFNDYDTKTNLLKIDLLTDSGESNATNTILLAEQWFAERTLTRRLEELGVQVERGVEVTRLSESGSIVEATLTSSPISTSPAEELKETQVKAKYVVGCDGAHSFVRHHLGIEFRGERYPATYALGHVKVDACSLDSAAVSIEVGKRGFVFASPMCGDTWVFVFDLDEEERSRCSGEQPSVEDLQRMFEARGMSGTFHSPVWQTFFNVHSRQAEKYRHGRMFLCGDAAHIHSPLGGQGMNMGLQDAHNLAWKLAFVINGKATDHLLDSYDLERRTVDKQILNIVENVHQIWSLRAGVGSFVRNNVAQFAGTFQFVLDTGKSQLGQTAYSYSFSSLSSEYWPRIPIWFPFRRRAQNIFRHFGRRVRGGDRVPDCSLPFVQVSAQGGNGCDDEQAPPQRLYPLLHATRGFKAIIFARPRTSAKHGDEESVAYQFALELLRVSNGVVTAAVVVPSDASAAQVLFGANREASVFLVRPDGYVGLRVDALTGACAIVQSYFSTRLFSPLVNDTGDPCALDRQDWVPAMLGSGVLAGWAYVISQVARGKTAPHTVALGGVLSLATLSVLLQVSLYRR